MGTVVVRGWGFFAMLVVFALFSGVLAGCGDGKAANPTPTATLIPRPVTSAPPPSPTVVAPNATPASTPAMLAVGNTKGDGVFIRKAPAGERIGVWPDGALMQVVGEDKAAEGMTWRNVKDPAGNVGWIAADYLVITNTATTAPPAPAATPPAKASAPGATPNPSSAPVR